MGSKSTFCGRPPSRFCWRRTQSTARVAEAVTEIVREASGDSLLAVMAVTVGRGWPYPLTLALAVPAAGVLAGLDARSTLVVVSRDDAAV